MFSCLKRMIIKFVPAFRLARDGKVGSHHHNPKARSISKVYSWRKSGASFLYQYHTVKLPFYSMPQLTVIRLKLNTAIRRHRYTKSVSEPTVSVFWSGSDERIRGISLDDVFINKFPLTQRRTIKSKPSTFQEPIYEDSMNPNYHFCYKQKQPVLNSSRVSRISVQATTQSIQTIAGVQVSEVEAFQHRGILEHYRNIMPGKVDALTPRRRTSTRTIEPIKRGGKPRGTTHTPKIGVESVEKPELVCRKQQMQWVVGVELPETFVEINDVSVFQEKIELKNDHRHEYFWPLQDLRGKVEVEYGDGSSIRQNSISLGNEDYLLFKLGGQARSVGRHIKTAAAGWHLLIVRQLVNLEEGLSDSCELTPEVTVYPGHLGYVVAFEKGDLKLAFRDRQGKLVEIRPRSSHFELAGNRISDGDAEKGPLFGKQLPRICAKKITWRSVKTVIFGEEGSKKNRWRTEFHPVKGNKEQELPIPPEHIRSSWYFLRFYDDDNNLIESLDFRFLSSLIKIEFQPARISPSHNGHESVSVQIFHEEGCIVHRCDDTPVDIGLARESKKTLLTVPAISNCDRSRWSVTDKSRTSVELFVVVERIWWAVGEEYDLPTAWIDQRIELSPDDFKATSNKALWLLFPEIRFTKTVDVGFSESSIRPYPVKVDERAVSIPLRDYCDAPELRMPGLAWLKVWIPHHGTQTIPVCELKINAECTFCGFSSDNEDDLLSHIKASHSPVLRETYFKSLSYNEVRNSFPELKLPSRIYKCGHCKFYVKADDYSDHPTSSICKHIEDYCQVVDREHGPPSLSFFPVSNADEVRKNVIASLPHVYRCTKCDEEFRDPEMIDLFDHFAVSHKEMLFKPR